jgi:hypothetical protein
MAKESNTKEDNIQPVCGLGIPRAAVGSMLLLRVVKLIMTCLLRLP